MKLSLVVLNAGKTQGQAIPIKFPQFVIGRDPGCNLRPASAMISKRHCAILVKDGRVFLQDFGSTNGTFLNDQPVKGEVPLNQDDVLKIGPLLFKVAIEKPAVSKPTPPPPSQAPKRLAPDDDSAAALLLSMDDDGSPSAATTDTAEAEVPGGSTIMEMPAFTPPAEAEAAAKPAEKKAEEKPKHDSAQSAARAILDQMRRGGQRRSPFPRLRVRTTRTRERESTSRELSEAPLNLSAPQRTQLRRRLLAWFDRHARDLPWRRDRDPYRIWVSEVMLQQTQVAAVVPYFERFLQRFPTLAALAEASEQDVLCLWEGLGYYRRARDLHRAARLIHAEHAGRLPDEPDILQRLPGFGRYTTNAVLSQAHDRRLPILEANSERVLCRLLAVRDDPKQGATRRQLWEAAELLLPSRRAGDFNQALMELGALVCTPARPQCPTCPVASFCEANRLGLQDEIPRKAKKADTVLVDEVAVVVHRGDKLLLVQRPAAGRWASMWEFPRVVQEPLETPVAAAERLLAGLGMRATVRCELLTVRHGVTRFRITLTCLEAVWRKGSFCSAAYAAGVWVRPDELANYPISVPQRQITRRLVSAP